MCLNNGGDNKQKRVAFYGGSFDPIHNGHLAIARELLRLFEFDEFWFVPAFQAPHKRDRKTTAAFCRYAMLALATQNEPRIKISTIELDAPEKPFTIETLTKLKAHYKERAAIFFVMGADSWNEIDTWREWQKLLTLTNFVVVTRPNFPIQTAHVTAEISGRIVDLREQNAIENAESEQRIFVTDAVLLDVSATEIRREVAARASNNWRAKVAPNVADYIEKYKLYSER